MSTRKVAKPAKKAAKKTPAKSAKKAAAVASAAPVPAPVPAPEPTPIVVAAAPIQETFVSGPANTPPHTTVSPERVLVYINGNHKGQILHGGKTLGEFARGLAQESGIRTFSIYVDEQKANTTMADMKLDAVGKIEIVPKDSRG